jgi:hypothetical protein
MRIDLVGTTADFRGFGPRRSLPINHLLRENRQTAGRIGQDGLDGIIDGDRYFLSPRIKTLRAIRAKIRPEPVRAPLPPPAKQYAPPRATAKQRRRVGR